jgi:hypothetical protein
MIRCLKAYAHNERSKVLKASHYYEFTSVLDQKKKGVNCFLFLALVYLGLNYFQPLLILGLPSISSISKYIGSFVGLLMVVALFNSNAKRDFLAVRSVYLIVAIINIILISSLCNPSITFLDTINRFYEIFSCVIAYFVFMHLSKDTNAAKIILVSFAVFALCNVSIGLYGSITGHSILSVTRDQVGVGAFGFDQETGRSGGIRGENYVGIWNSPALALGLVLFITTKKIHEILLSSMFIVSTCIAAIVSFSRGSILSTIIVIVLSVFILRKKFSINKLFLCILVLTFTCIFATSILNVQQSYFNESIENALSERLGSGTHDVRTTLWAGYIDNLLDTNPLFGGGPGYTNDPRVLINGYIPHNSLLHVAVEHGFAGLFMYCVVIMLVIFQFKTMLSSQNADIYGIMACIIFCGMSVGLFFLSDPFMKIYWITAGIIKGRSIR